MADVVPAVGGAKESAVPAAETSRTGAGEAATTSPSGHAVTAEQTAGPETVEEDGTATVAEETIVLESKDKHKETAEGKTTQATAEPEASSAAAAVATDASLQTPQLPPPAVTRTRAESLSIGAPDDGTILGAAVDDSVVCNITLLLPTGARHPYRIDEKYLAKRNVDVPGVTESGKKDPFSVSVYKLKELILREWRDDWEGKPASPSSIRLIHFGKLLDDKEQLRKYHFSAEAPNVVHMSVKPAEMLEEDEAGKSKSGGRESRAREGGAGCCVIL